MIWFLLLVSMSHAMFGKCRQIELAMQHAILQSDMRRRADKERRGSKDSISKYISNFEVESPWKPPKIPQICLEDLPIQMTKSEFDICVKVSSFLGGTHSINFVEFLTIFSSGC